MSRTLPTPPLSYRRQLFHCDCACLSDELLTDLHSTCACLIDRRSSPLSLRSKAGSARSLVAAPPSIKGPAQHAAVLRWLLLQSSCLLGLSSAAEEFRGTMSSHTRSLRQSSG